MSSRPPEHDRRSGPRFYTLAEAARILEVSPKTLRAAIAAGHIPAIRVGPKAVRIPAAALELVPADEGAESDRNPYPWLGA